MPLFLAMLADHYDLCLVNHAKQAQFARTG